MLNDVDGAFAQAQFYEPADPKWGPFLFLDRHRRCVLIRRFMALAVKFGFAAYWRSTGQWPDFCKRPGPALQLQSGGGKACGRKSRFDADDAAPAHRGNQLIFRYWSDSF